MQNVFKQARLQKNLLLSDVSEKICYSSYIIEAIENDKINFLPKPYNYYCAKNYAEFLNLKEIDDILLKYK